MLSLPIPPRLCRDMGLTLDDFLRSLPSAVAPYEYRSTGRCFTVGHPSGPVVITLGETTQRRIASLSLPVTPVTFEFNGMDEAERGRFMQRFDRYFQRGGG